MAGRGLGGFGQGGQPQAGLGLAGDRVRRRWNAHRTRALQALAARAEVAEPPAPEPPPEQPVAQPVVECLWAFPADHPVRQILAVPMLERRMLWQGWYRHPEAYGRLSIEEQNSVLDLTIECAPGEYAIPPPPIWPPP